MTKSQLRKINKRKIFKKTQNIVHNNIPSVNRFAYYPITNKRARVMLPLLLEQLRKLEKGIVALAKTKSKKVSWRNKFNKASK